MPRPGGNPDLAKHQYTTKREKEDKCVKLISLRVPKRQEAIKKIANWQDLLREKIDEILKEYPQDGGGKD